MHNYLSTEERLAAAIVARDALISLVRKEGGLRPTQRIEDPRIVAAEAEFRSGHRVSVQVSLVGKVHYGISSAAGLHHGTPQDAEAIARYLTSHTANQGAERLAQAR